MSKEIPSLESLTVSQRAWLEHLSACRKQGGSLKEYAQAHSLSLSGLYTAKRVLTKLGVWQRSVARAAKRSAPTLVPVRLKAAAAMATMFRVVLPNGVVVEVPEHADVARCRELLACVMEALR